MSDSLNITCDGSFPPRRYAHQCPHGGPFLNYTCNSERGAGSDGIGVAYTVPNFTLFFTSLSLHCLEGLG